MKSIKHHRSLSRTYHRCQLIEISFLDALHAAKMLQQCLAGLGSYTCYRVKLRHKLTFTAAIAVMGYTEPVCLIAQMLNHTQAL